MLARIEGEIIHHAVVFCPDVVEAPVVSKSAPLHVDTHPSLISFYHLNIPHFLHVACVTTSAYNHTDTFRLLGNRKPVYSKGSFQGKLTSNESNLTGRFLIGAGHHGSHCIIHYGHDIQVKFLRRKHIKVYSLAHSCIF